MEERQTFQYYEPDSFEEDDEIETDSELEFEIYTEEKHFSIQELFFKLKQYVETEQLPFLCHPFSSVWFEELCMS